MEAFNIGDITFVAILINATNGILSLKGHREMRTLGITHHVGHLVNNASLHSFTVMVNEEDICFNCHARENFRHLLMDRQNKCERLVHVVVCHLSFGCVILCTSVSVSDKCSGDQVSS